MRRSMMIDIDKCVGCQACVTSCKERWDSGPGATRNWVLEYEHGERGKDLGITFYPGLCMQCEEHPCTEDCPTGATYMDEEIGVVLVNPDVCIGCSNCVSMCAYNARKPDPVKGIVEKCDLCAAYVNRGGKPACVATCLGNCRHFGDLDDPDGDLVKLISQKGAMPLRTADVDVRPKVTYAGKDHVKYILSQGVVKSPQKSGLTAFWQDVSRPFASIFTPAVAAVAVTGGLLLNLKNRKEQIKHDKGASAQILQRHRTGIRFLHWFNIVSWLLLLATGTGLMSAKRFALFGEEFPSFMSDVFGGAATLIKFHVVWGILWTVVIIPVFLVYKRFGLAVFEELRLTRDDLDWIKSKPLSILGFSKKPLPPQDKYNAGQKLFAMAVLLGTLGIIATGLVMSFHIGPPSLVAASILAHKLAIAITIIGVAVHVTMAAVLKEERPALVSMIKGSVDLKHAQEHNAKWAKQVSTSESKGNE